MDSKLDTLTELAGLALLVAFAYVVWPPAALLAGGLILFVGSNARAARRRRLAAAETATGAHRRRGTLDRVLAVVAALRSSS